MTALIIRLINYYQSKGGGLYWFNVDCCFEPTCSEYCKQAIMKYGLLQGLVIFVKRLRRCNNRTNFERIPDPL